MQDIDIHSLNLQANISTDKLTEYLEQLASYDFEKFIYLLYRLDIEEDKVRSLISKDENIFPTLALWIVEKLRTRNKNKDLYTYPELEDDEGRW